MKNSRVGRPPPPPSDECDDDDCVYRHFLTDDFPVIFKHIWQKIPGFGNEDSNTSKKGTYLKVTIFLIKYKDLETPRISL